MMRYSEKPLWGVALGFVFAGVVAVPTRALAQDEGELGADTTEAPPEDAASSEPAPEEPSPPEPEASPEPAPDPAVTATESPAAKPEPAAATPDVPAEKEAAAEPQVPANASLVDVRRVPASGYPEDKVRGVYGSSLFFTIPGYQWPYLPRKAGDPSVVFGVSGYAWADLSYRQTEPGRFPTDPRTRTWDGQGRAVLRATPTYNVKDDYFLQAQLELALRANQTTGSSVLRDVIDTDDLWVKGGKWKSFDVQFGRFQGWEVYHFGLGLDWGTVERQGATTSVDSTPPEIYGATTYWDRPSGALNLAAHWYPLDWFRVELLGRTGTDGGQNIGALRPVGIIDLGFLKLKGGGEYGKRWSPDEQAPVCNPNMQGQNICRPSHPTQRETRGGSGSIQFVFEPHVDFGFSGGRVLQDQISNTGTVDLGATTDTWSMGGFLNWNILASGLFLFGGSHYTDLKTLQINTTTGGRNNNSHLQTYGGLQYGLWDTMFIKFVFAHGIVWYRPLFDAAPALYQNEAFSGRLRVQWWF